MLLRQEHAETSANLLKIPDTCKVKIKMAFCGTFVLTWNYMTAEKFRESWRCFGALYALKMEISVIFLMYAKTENINELWVLSVRELLC